MKSHHMSTVRSNALTIQVEFQRFAVIAFTGIVLPALIHLIPSRFPLGPVLMPLFVPIAVAAYCLPMRSAIAAAVLLPFASFALTAMPPAPIALQMACEGLVFVGIARLTATRMRWFVSYTVSALGSRVIGLLYGTAILGGGFTATANDISLGLIGLAIAALALPALFRAYRS